MPYHQDNIDTTKPHDHVENPLHVLLGAQKSVYTTTQALPEEDWRSKLTPKRRMRRTGSSTNSQIDFDGILAKNQAEEYQILAKYRESEKRIAKLRRKSETEQHNNQSGFDERVTPNATLDAKTLAKDVEEPVGTRNVTPGSSPSRKRQRLYGDR